MQKTGLKMSNMYLRSKSVIKHDYCGKTVKMNNWVRGIDDFLVIYMTSQCLNNLKRSKILLRNVSVSCK